MHGSSSTIHVGKTTHMHLTINHLWTQQIIISTDNTTLALNQWDKATKATAGRSLVIIHNLRNLIIMLILKCVLLFKI